MYNNFAQIYDTLMQDIPYEKWAGRINTWIEKYGISKKRPGEAEDENEENLVVDLGCGTGTLTEMLAKSGYDMIGIDNSEDMLNIAAGKKFVNQTKTLYLCQNMQKMELYSTVGTFISVCDSLNYLLSENDILDTFKLVYNYLYPGGIFIFDFNTVYKYKEVIGNTTIAENHHDCAFIWENYYHPEECLNEYDLTFFIKEKSGYFSRHLETHFQRAYEPEQIISLLTAAGLNIISTIDEETKKTPHRKSERVVIIARKEIPCPTG